MHTDERVPRDPGGGIHIRAAGEMDAAAIAGLMGELGYPLAEETARARLRALADDPASHVLVAITAGTVAGVASTHAIPLLHRDGVLGRITSLVVASEHRNQGIGARLLRAAEDLLWLAGCQRIELTSGDARTEAHRFYEREGYRIESRRFLKRRRL